MLTLTSCRRADTRDDAERIALIEEWARLRLRDEPDNANALDMLWLVEKVRELSALTGELAGDLEAYINDHYLGPDIHPAMQAKYDRDMAIVRNARAALARAVA